MIRHTPTPTLVLVNSDAPLRRQLEQQFEAAGVRVGAAEPAQFAGEQELLAFLGDHGAHALLYEVPSHEATNWRLFQLVRAATKVPTRPFVLPCVGNAALARPSVQQHLVRALYALVETQRHTDGRRPTLSEALERLPRG